MSNDAIHDAGRRDWLRRHALAAAAAPLAGLLPSALQAASPAVGAAAPSIDGRLHLDLNESSYGPSPKVAAAVTQAVRFSPRYVATSQADALVAQIAALEGVSPAQVVVGEVLEALGQFLARSRGGGEFIYSVPGYGALVDAAAPFGGRAREVPLDAALGNDLPALLAAVGPQTRALFVVNPHNPSGTVSPAAAFDTFVVAAARTTLVIVDEAYIDYLPDAAQRSAVRLLREGHDVAVFRTLGKIHALAGLQIGYALVPATLGEALRGSGIGSAHGLNQLSVAAAAATLSDPDHVASVRRAVAAERDVWLALLRRHGLAYAEPAGNFIFIDTGRAHAQVAAALRERGIFVARAFAPYATWLRITIGTPTENARARSALLDALGKNA